jgi:single-strand DNA-binding protein
MNLNKAFILGHLTRDPESRTLPSGDPVVNFGVATNRYFKDREGNRKEETDFHNIVVFGRLAEIAKNYLSKGDLVLIEGRIQTRSWEDQSGQRRYRTEIIAQNLQLPPRKWQEGSTGPGSSPQGPVQVSGKDQEVPILQIEEESPLAQEKKPAKKSAAKSKKSDSEIDPEKDIIL